MDADVVDLLWEVARDSCDEKEKDATGNRRVVVEECFSASTEKLL